jgi:DNA-binding transcriptional MerR regulator
MEQPLDISEVVRRTGLSARALRFYEARGLVAPLRTASGRRLYGAGELARINQVVTLKAAGFSLADIGTLLARRPIDLGRMIAAQLEALETQAGQIAEARRLLQSAKSRVDRGEPLDAATLCSLIRTGDTVMEQENWKTVSDRYLSEEAKADFAKTAYPEGFNQADYTAKWADLVARIEAAMPMDPASAEAQAFYAEWKALLAPFSRMASPAMMQGVSTMYDNIDQWKGEQKAPFSSEVWAFIKAVGECGKAM